MKSLVVAGGVGKRLGLDIAKSMVPISGRPLLEHALASLYKAGVDDSIIITGYRANDITDYFGNGSKLGFRIKYVDYENSNGTAEAIYKAKSYFDDDFLLSYGDVIADSRDINGLINSHEKTRPLATLASKRFEDVSKLGALDVDSNGIINSIVEKPNEDMESSGLASLGIYAVSPKIFDYIRLTLRMPISELENFSSRGYDFATHILKSAIKDGNVRNYTFNRGWIHITTKEDLLKAESEIGLME